MGREVLEQIKSMFFSLTLVYQCMGLIKHCNENFGRFHWKDPGRARQLINQGMAAMTNNPTVDHLQPIAAQLVDLMPESEKLGPGGLLH